MYWERRDGGDRDVWTAWWGGVEVAYMLRECGDEWKVETYEYGDGWDVFYGTRRECIAWAAGLCN